MAEEQDEQTPETTPPEGAADNNDNNDEASDTTMSSEANQMGDSSTAVADGSAADSMAVQLQAAREAAAEYKDKYLRERAEMDNFRKRQERIAGERNQRYKRDLIERVLDVVDNLDRAMQYKDTMDREGLQQSLLLVQVQLNELLKAEGLTPVATVGEPFDPYQHEAVDSVASTEHPEGIVTEEVRKGYMMGGDLLRPARVMVSAGAKE